MSTTCISFDISSSDFSARLGLEAWIDNTEIFSCDHVQQAQTITFDLSNDDSEHELRFILKNKTGLHTQIDKDGTIVKDAVLTVDNLKFDDIELGQIFSEHAVYTHNFNRSAAETRAKFYGSLGCNGTVSLKFSTPIYIWLLENT
jgi:AAA15 family ATPase/GTPase